MSRPGLILPASARSKRGPRTIGWNELQCIKFALLDCARYLGRYNHTWDPRHRDAFIHAYNAVRDPEEPNGREMFRGTKPGEDTRTIVERLAAMGVSLPTGAAG